MRSRLAKARSLLAEYVAKLGVSAKLIDSTLSGLDGWASELRVRFSGELDHST